MLHQCSIANTKNSLGEVAWNQHKYRLRNVA